MDKRPMKWRGGAGHAPNRRFRTVRRVIFSVGMALCVAVPASSPALLVTFTLEEMIMRSDMIVVGMVSNERTPGTRTIVYRDEQDKIEMKVQYSFAEVDALEVIMGKPNSPRRLKIMFAASLFEDIALKRGEKAIFFIEEHKGGYRVTQGVNGKCDIVDSLVRTSGIRDEPGEQPYDEFIRKIREGIRKRRRAN